MTGPTLPELITGFHHTAIGVADFDAALAFFRDICGMRVESEIASRDEPGLGVVVGMPGAAARWAMLERDGRRIELFRYTRPEGGPAPIRQCDHGIIHIAFQVSDVDAVCAALRAAGWETLSDPVTLRGGGSRPIYVRGPEGIVVEFVETPARPRAEKG